MKTREVFQPNFDLVLRLCQKFAMCERERQLEASRNQNTARTTLIRHPVPTRRIQSLTAETRVNRVQASTYHNYTEQWVRLQTRYNCECGRHIGIQIQEPLVGQPSPRFDDEVITIRSTPPASIVQNISISSSDGEAIVIDDSTDSSSLLEEVPGVERPYVDPEASDPSDKSDESVKSDSQAKPNCDTDTKSCKSIDEPMC